MYADNRRTMAAAMAAALAAAMVAGSRVREL